MSNIRELNSEEIAQVSGGGNSGDHDNLGRSSSGYSGGSGFSGGIPYGAQANGFLSNTAAAVGSGISKECAVGIATGALGVIGSIPSRNPISIGSAVATAGISIAATCNTPSSKNSPPFR